MNGMPWGIAAGSGNDFDISDWTPEYHRAFRRAYFLFYCATQGNKIDWHKGLPVPPKKAK